MSEDFYDQALAERQTNPAQLAEEDLKWIMSSPRGRRVMQRVLEATNHLQSSFVAGDPHVTAFNEGRRYVGLLIVTDIRRHCPHQEFAMNEERHTQ